MKLIEQIKADRMVAFKAKENIKKNLLGCLISDSTKIDKEPSDEFVLSIIKKFIENAKFVIDKTNEKDFEFYQANQEIEILEKYRPEQLSETEILNVISMLKFQDKKLPEIMKHFKETFSGRYDGKLVSELIKKDDQIRSALKV
jgi:uncharacterized protein